MFYHRRTNEHKLRGLKQLPLLVSRHVGQEARKSLTEFPAVCHACGQGDGWAVCLSAHTGEDSGSRTQRAEDVGRTPSSLAGFRRGPLLAPRGHARPLTPPSWRQQ